WASTTRSASPCCSRSRRSASASPAKAGLSWRTENWPGTARCPPTPTAAACPPTTPACAASSCSSRPPSSCAGNPPPRSRTRRSRCATAPAASSPIAAPWCSPGTDNLNIKRPPTTCGGHRKGYENGRVVPPHRRHRVRALLERLQGRQAGHQTLQGLQQGLLLSTPLVPQLLVREHRVD